MFEKITTNLLYMFLLQNSTEESRMCHFPLPKCQGRHCGFLASLLFLHHVLENWSLLNEKSNDIKLSDQYFSLVYYFLVIYRSWMSYINQWLRNVHMSLSNKTDRAKPICNILTLINSYCGICSKIRQNQLNLYAVLVYDNVTGTNIVSLILWITNCSHPVQHERRKYYPHNFFYICYI